MSSKIGDLYNQIIESNSLPIWRSMSGHLSEVEVVVCKNSVAALAAAGYLEPLIAGDAWAVAKAYIGYFPILKQSMVCQ
jgi:hypothetical protein